MTNILVPVAWPYANGPRHIGHIAGFGVPSDVFARYMRMQGHNVLMISGTDEHGTPILVQAEENGMSAQEFVNKNNELIVDDLIRLGLTYDLFTRTTTTNHKNVVQNIFTSLLKNGYVFEEFDLTAFSGDMALPDRYIEGECPICHADDARGDQCDTCGNQLNAFELINPRSKIDGKMPKFEKSKHFFLDLPALKDVISDWLDTRKDWRVNVLNFSKSLVKDVKPRAITRDISWGVKIPFDGYDSKRFYVWFDAVIGYLSASIEWAKRFGKNRDSWKDFWLDKDSKSYYFMGKDNITFHSQIWPSILSGHNGKNNYYGELELPTNIVSSEFLNMDGKQFSSSRNHVVLVRDMLEKYQTDALRFYIAIAGPENHDTNFTFEDFYKRVNEELVANWGNLISRSLTLVSKNFGEIPEIDSALTQDDQKLLSTIEDGFNDVSKLLDINRQQDAFKTIFSLSKTVNQYIATQEPWAIKDITRLKTVLHVILQCVSDINIMFSPFLPFSSQKVWKMLGFQGDIAPFPLKKTVQDFEDKNFSYFIITGDYKMGGNICSWGRKKIIVGKKIEKPKPIFNKLNESDLKNE